LKKQKSFKEKREKELKRKMELKPLEKNGCSVISKLDGWCLVLFHAK
jgi:hypothetical protein